MRFIIACLVTLGAALLPQCASAAPVPTLEPIEALVSALGSTKPPEREAAARKLVERGEAAIPALERALKSDDRRVRRQAEAILDKIRDNVVTTKVNSMVGDLRTAGIDRFIDEMVLKPKRANKDGWEQALRLAEAMTMAASHAGGKKWALPKDKFLTFPVAKKLTLEGSDRRRLLTDGLDEGLIENCMVVSSGPVTVKQRVMRSILLIDGDLRVDEGPICDSFVFCTGDVEVKKAYLLDSIVLSAKDVIANDYITNTLVEAQGVRSKGYSKDSVFLNVARFEIDHSRGDKNQESTNSPLSFVKTFTEARYGLSLKAIKKGLRIDSIEADSPFARASFRVGDVIKKVEDDPAETLHVFRRLLRRRVTVHGEAGISIQRGDDLFEIRLKLP